MEMRIKLDFGPGDPDLSRGAARVAAGRRFRPSDNRRGTSNVVDRGGFGTGNPQSPGAKEYR
jgi:hypothetical protein